MKKYLLGTALIILFLWNCTTKMYPAKAIQFHPNKIVAHRGAWKKLGLPENSLAALRQAVKMEFGGSEFDVRMTKDEVLIINHDPHFHNLDIEKHTYSELNAFQLSNGEQLPTLKTYLQQGIQNNSGTQLVLEIKPSELSKDQGSIIAKKVFALVEKLNAKSWISYISFDLEILKTLESLDHTVSTQYLNGDLSPDQLKEYAINGLDYHFSVFKNHPEWIQSAKLNKQILNTWTVNEAQDMDFFIQEGFDFITTNEPELLRSRIDSISTNH